MGSNSYILAGYGIFLFVLLIINLLYFFQVFKYRLPGDASIGVLAVYVSLILAVMGFGTLLVFS